MKRFIQVSLLSTALWFLTFATPPAEAQQGGRPYNVPQQGRVLGDQLRSMSPNLAGVWYLNGDLAAPCEIRWGPTGTALFTDAVGVSSWGVVSGDAFYVPLTDGSGRGLDGYRVGNRIIWSDGNYWTR